MEKMKRPELQTTVKDQAPFVPGGQGWTHEEWNQAGPLGG
jgi:hypothetical protein